MKRRDFIKKSVTGTTALGAFGCSTTRPRHIDLELKIAGFSTEVTKSKPSSGTMPSGEIGTTGITVSKFGYGAHLIKEVALHEKERQKMIREAYDLGITFFDVYDRGIWEIYQYEPMGRHLAPMINDVVISIMMEPFDGRTLESEFERDLTLFRRDYIDMVRSHAPSPESSYWGNWEKLFRLKEKGYIRAVGTPIHYPKDIEIILEQIPIDYVFIPYNFYHNLLADGNKGGNFNPLVAELRKRGIGIITMKPFGSDWFVNSLIKAAETLDETHEISLPQAALRYIINSGLNPDATLGGMYMLDHVYENVEAYYKTEMS
ncbi:MAG TPA: aldo/keto reductase, partial [Anaerolineae bacterium]|nr:aldo/keto reductase [Anaerolineae bacterium]